MNVTAGAKTDPGQRPNNEDQYAIVDTRRRQMRADGVLIIADGMGGRSFGEQAAQTAVETVEETLAEVLDSRQEGDVAIGDALASALRKANARVYELARADEDRKGMGTTCVAAVIEGETLYVAHAGDSRAYLLRDGALRQITDDHSYVAEQVRAGAISEEGARRSRFRNIITRAVGIEPTIEAEVAELEVRPGDLLLLCTDGLSNMVEEEDMAKALGQAATPQAAADRLVQMASKSGGKDNITAVVARLQVGTRTQRFRTADFSRPEAHGETEPEYDGQEKGAAPPRRRRRSRLWTALAALLIALGLGTSAWFGSLLLHEGYRFRAKPPFVVKPGASDLVPTPGGPVSRKSLDPAHVAYQSPVVFYFMPVRGDLLTLNPHDGSVTVAALSGALVTLSPDGGQVKYKFRLPGIHAQAPAPPGALGAGGGVIHTATDPEGDLYVSNALAKNVTKFRPNGVPLGLVSHLALTNPQSIAVAADGTIYLIDAQRLKVLHARPSTTPLPPIPMPKPAPPKPAAPVLPTLVPTQPNTAPTDTGRRFGTSYRRDANGYRHYGTGYRRTGTGYHHYGPGYHHYGHRRAAAGTL